MDFLDISNKRRTVRKFAQTPVEKEKLQKILEAGRGSPTAVTESRCLRPAFITECRNRFVEKIRRKGTDHESAGTPGLPG